MIENQLTLIAFKTKNKNKNLIWLRGIVYNSRIILRCLSEYYIPPRESAPLRSLLPPDTIWALFYRTSKSILRNELVLLGISESSYENLHLPFYQKWYERMITFLRVANRPHVRNSHNGSQAPRARKEGACQSLWWVKVQASPLHLPRCSRNDLQRTGHCL